MLVLFDSLNRSAVGCYGGRAVSTPHFDDFAARSVRFDNHYVGSLPCMPARRDIHSGRLSFMHRSWGPLEPFDNSCMQILRNHGVYTRLVSDHFHYFEDGGGGYHTRFSSFDFIRGQEYDPWKAMVQPPLERFRELYSRDLYDFARDPKRLNHAINRHFIREEADFPGPRCFQSAFEFLDSNRQADNWLLMLECFDPHEPFWAPKRFQEAYVKGYDGPILDWPHYSRVCEDPEQIKVIRGNYAALAAMCDDYFGRLLAYMDRYDMWKDTALILTTDHGFLLSEHGWWGKCRMPYYEEISHIPLLVYHPDFSHQGGTRRLSLTQTIDLMPSLLEMFGVAVPEEVRGHALRPLLGGEHKLRDHVTFGLFGGPVGVSDGRWVYYHYPPDLSDESLNEYTLMPTHVRGFFSADELRSSSLHPPFDFTKGVPVLRVTALKNSQRVPNNDGHAYDDQGRKLADPFDDIGSRLYDLSQDPKQEHPVHNPEVSRRLLSAAMETFRAHDTPPEVYRWYGIEHLL